MRVVDFTSRAYNSRAAEIESAGRGDRSVTAAVGTVSCPVRWAELAARISPPSGMGTTGLEPATSGVTVERTGLLSFAIRRIRSRCGGGVGHGIGQRLPRVAAAGRGHGKVARSTT